MHSVYAVPDPDLEIRGEGGGGRGIVTRTQNVVHRLGTRKNDFGVVSQTDLNRVYGLCNNYQE